MKKKILFVMACVAMLCCLLAVSVSAEGVDPNADYYDKVYTDLNGREFPIYEKDGDTYYPLVWFAYDDAETGEKIYVKARFEDINPYSLETSQGRFNGCFYTHTDENGNTVELNTTNLIVLNLRAGVMAKTYSSSKKHNGTNIIIKKIETNRADLFPKFSNLEAVYIPLSQISVGSLDIGKLRVCDIDRNHGPLSFGNKAFQNSSLEEIFIPSGSTFDNNSNFQGCTKLKKVVFGETAPTSIPNYCFDRCSALELVCFLGDNADITVGTASNGYYTGLTKMSYQEYEALEDKSGKYIVYNATQCLAFGHDILEDERVVVGNDFFSEMTVACPCGVEGCGATVTVSTIAPMFTDKGYAARIFGEGYAVTQSYLINRTAIAEYEKYAEIEFGVVATVNAGGEAIAPVLGGEGVYSADLWDIKMNDYLDIIVTNIPNNSADVESGADASDNKYKNIVFCLYAKDGEDVSFLDGGKTVQSLTGISYQTIFDSTEK